MDIVKKNLVSIICGVVALLAVVAAFVWPLNGYLEELQEKVKKRAAVEQKVQSLLNKSRTVPVFTVDPSKPEADRLPKFPSTEIIDKGKKAMKLVRTQSEKVYDAAWQLNNAGHGLVAEGSLPRPVSDRIAILFRQTLQDELDRLRTEVLLAGIPPTDEEIENRKGMIWQEMQKKFIVIDNEVKNQEAVMAQYHAAADKVRDQMKEEMATKWKMYIDPVSVMRVPAYVPSEGGRSAEPNQIWWAQVAFWVTQDVAAAIKDLNASSSKVADSPVKNLVVLSIPDHFHGVTTASGGGIDRGAAAGEEGQATGGPPDPTIAVPEKPALSPTKRASNNLFDVLHFRLVVDVEADKVPLFIKTLATNRFISVLRLEMNPVDSQLKQIQGYVYGPRPVVTLDLDCEAVFMRQWTLKYMPRGKNSVREQLGIPDDQTGRQAMNQ
jgi:hypothetical protein